MFFGSFEGGIDAKGRVSVPASFRAALGSTGRIIVWPAMDGSGCLEGGGEALLNSYRAILSQMSPSDPLRRSFSHCLFTKSAELVFDATGRVVLPKTLMEAAGLTSRVLFAGSDDRFHIWDPDRFVAYDERMSTLAADNQSQLEQPFRDALAAGLLKSAGGGS